MMHKNEQMSQKIVEAVIEPKFGDPELVFKSSLINPKNKAERAMEETKHIKGLQKSRYICVEHEIDHMKK